MTGLFKAAVRAFALTCAVVLAPLAAHAEDIVVTHYASLLYGTPYAVALEKGYFKDAGVDVSGVLTSKGGGTSVRNMMAGDTLFAEVALPAALSAIKEGFKIKIVSGGTDGPSGFWVTRPDAPINKPEDLKGKRFVFSRPKSVSEAQIFAILKSHNIPVSDVKMVAIGDFGAGITALEHDKVDVAIIPEPIYSQKIKEGAKYKVLDWLDAKVPPSNQTVGIATDETIAKRADKLKAVIEARRRGVEFIYKDPKQAAAIVAKAYNLAPDVAASAIDNTLKQTATWWSNGELKQPMLDEMANGLGAVGALDLPVDWKTVIAAGFAPPPSAKQ